MPNKGTIYIFVLTVFLDAAGDTDYNTIDLVFCEHCAEHIKSTFEKNIRKIK